MQNIADNEAKAQEKDGKELMLGDVPKTTAPQDLFTALNPQFDVVFAQLKGKVFN